MSDEETTVKQEESADELTVARARARKRIANSSR